MLLPVVVSAILVVTVYAMGDRLMFRLATAVSHRWQAARRLPLRTARNLVHAVLWPVVLTCLFAVVVTVLGVSLPNLFIPDLPPVMWLLGLLLGVGESGLASILCYALARSLPSAGPRGMSQRTGAEFSRWSAPLVTALRVVPLPFGLALALYHGAMEELTLRGAFLAAGRSLEAGWLAVVSVGLSLLVQVFPWGSWRNSLFALAGTLVSAPVHVLLFLHVPDVRPLIVAQSLTLLLAVR